MAIKQNFKQQKKTPKTAFSMVFGRFTLFHSNSLLKLCI